MEIVLDHVAKTFPGGAEVLSDVHLTVRNGELLALVGPSGCGKTTTLRMIAGLEQPTRGTIRIGEKVVNALPAHERDVGMVFQRPALYPHRTIRDNLLFGNRLRHPWKRLFRFLSRNSAKLESQEAETALQVARSVGLADLLDRYPPQLSGGQQQRAALGRALLRRPGVLLLDEPLGHLDAPLRHELRRQLHLLHSQLPATMIHVTHDPTEALALGDRVAVLDEGVVQQLDRPDIIVQQPANRLVARLMCQRLGPMNFLDGRLVGAGGGAVFLAHGQQVQIPAEVAGKWLACLEQDVTVGLGPENITVSDMNPGVGVIPGTVILIESNGNTLMGTCAALGRELTGVAVSGRTMAAGQEVFLSVDWAQAMLFDQKHGQTLAVPGVMARGEGAG
jgi:multiple sugar transport system ATP-binding protein